MERVHTVDDTTNVTYHTFANVGEDYATGVEFSVNANLLKIWKINYMANVYDYRLESNLPGSESTLDDFNWSLRLNNTLKFNDRTQFQVSGMYRSKTITAQGEREGFPMINLALKHEFIPKKLTATLQVRDLFDSAKREMILEGTNFESYLYRDRDAPVVSLKISYNINNYKPERQRGEHNGGDDNGGDNGGVDIDFGTVDIEVELTNTGVFPDASGDAKLEPRTDRTDFSVEIEDVPVGSYGLRIGGETVGAIEVVMLQDGSVEGELEFRNPVEPGKILLDFDPRGKQIDVLDGSTLVLETLFPSE